jgi:multicomponent Na+:H+ antiporter subunit E
MGRERDQPHRELGRGLEDRLGGPAFAHEGDDGLEPRVAEPSRGVAEVCARLCPRGCVSREEGLDRLEEGDLRRRRGASTMDAESCKMPPAFQGRCVALMSERDPRTPADASRNVRRIGIRIAGYAFVWWVVAEGAAASWTVGAPAVLLAALVGWSLASPRPAGWRLGGLLRFMAHFVLRSLHGGLDVARRAIDPRLPLAPAMVPYRLRLPRDGAGAVFFVDMVNLLPGTLCAAFDGDRLTVHVVDRARPVLDDLRELEVRVAGLFGEELAPASAGEGATP